MRTDNPCDSPYILMNRIHPRLLCPPPMGFRKNPGDFVLHNKRYYRDVRSATPNKDINSSELIECSLQKSEKRTSSDSECAVMKYRSDVLGV